MRNTKSKLVVLGVYHCRISKALFTTAMLSSILLITAAATLANIPHK